MAEKKGKKILVAEDEKPMARALELKLTKEGFLPQIASDGEEALAALAKEKFDLVLLDLIMPKKDGFAVLEALQQKGDKTPVIISSNLSQEEDVRRVKALGAKDYFIKSSTPINDVIKHIKRVLGI